MPGADDSVLLGMTRFEVVRRARWRPHRFVVVLYVAFVLLGYHGGSPEWVGEAGLALLVFTLYAGFGVDRQLGYDQLVTSNWVGAGRYTAAKILSLAVSLFVTAFIVGTTVLIGSSGAWGQVAWHSLLFLTLAVYFLPLVLLVELEMESRLPMVGVVPLVAVLWGVLAWIVGPDAVSGWLVGPPPTAERGGALGPLAARAMGVSLPLALALLYGVRRRVAGPAR